MEATDTFTITTDNQHVSYEGKVAPDGRWYWHRAVNGRIAYSNNHASRRSARRAILRDMTSEGLAEVK